MQQDESPIGGGPNFLDWLGLRDYLSWPIVLLSVVAIAVALVLRYERDPGWRQRGQQAAARRAASRFDAARRQAEGR